MRFISGDLIFLEESMKKTREYGEDSEKMYFYVLSIYIVVPSNSS